jgi:two-component system nitrogen regulation sensor histidine kinase NtrY
VSTGNLQIQVPTRRSGGDLAQLGDLQQDDARPADATDDIVRARDLIDSRRRFTEAVLAGTPAPASSAWMARGGSASSTARPWRLMGHTEAEVLGRPFSEVMPELVDLFTTARTGSQRLIQGQVTINRSGRDRNLNVRVTRELSGEADQSHHVITLDDITELVTAQRTSAWADIARRIAHEIKNPLTPIQLSAERLRRRYGPLIKDESGVFQQCTDTIVRQVDDIKRMVDEFSQFARMPKPVIGAEDVADVVRQAVFLQRVGNADIDIDVEFAEERRGGTLELLLTAPAVTNIIKNATEAIAAVPAGQIEKGRILVAASREGGDILIDVIDNGIGLPKENRSRLLEPYVTTREKGTGLGLAIVGRILEEHGGKIELRDAAERIPGQRGAWMQLRFAAAPVATEPERKVAAAGH